MNKKSFFTLLLIIFAFIIPCIALGATKTIEFENSLQTNEVKDFLLVIIEHLQTIIASIAILFIVIGGIMYILSGGSENRVKIAKNIWVGSIIGLILALIAPTFLREIQEVFFVGGSLPQQFDQVRTLQDIILRVTEFLLSIIGTLAIISLVGSGITYIFALGDSSRTETAKKVMQWSIFGIALAGSSLLIVKQIITFIKIP